MALPAVIASVVSGAASAAGGSAAGGASAAASSLSGVGGAVGQLGQVCDWAKRPVGKLTEEAGKASHKLTSMMTAFIDLVQAAAGPVQRLVAIHNPARAEAFTRAMTDAYGVIGRLLTPVMDAFTRTARKVGDVMARMEPIFKPLMEAVSQIIDTIADDFVAGMEKNAPGFQNLADVLTKVAQVVNLAAQGLSKLLNVARDFVGGIARILGFGGTAFDPKASAVGAGHRQARFVGPKQISDDAIKSSLMQGIGVQKKTPEQALNDIAGFTGKLWDWYEKNGEELIGRAKRTAERGEKIASDPTYAGRQFLRWAAAKAGF